MTESELRCLYRRYNLTGLLEAINHESLKIARNEESAHIGFQYMEIERMIPYTKMSVKQMMIITAWDLIDMAYHAIMYTNENRGKGSITDNELMYLYSADEVYRETQSHNTHAIITGTNHFDFYLWGFCGEQLRFQKTAYALQNAARDMYILLDMAPRIGFTGIEKAICEETGCSWQAIVATLFVVWAGFTQGNEMPCIQNSIKWDEEYTQDLFQTVICRYASTYKEIRASEYGRQIFYTKPYIITEKGIIGINTFLNLFAYEHCLLWVLRDYYRKRNSQQFAIEFGEMYEEYLRELYENNVGQGKYNKIKRSNKKKRADWSLRLFDYSFLIEQKASLIGLSVKQQDTNFASMEKYAQNTIMKAMRQLKETEQEFEKEYIKIILLYEDYLKPEILDKVFLLPECDIMNDHRYWLMTIQEMEELLYQYSHNPELCLQIINEKIKRENGEIPPGRGKGFDTLFLEFDVEIGGIFEQQKLQYYELYAQQYLSKRLKS